MVLASSLKILSCVTINEMPTSAATKWIEERAKALGFATCGIVRAERFPELERVEEWLSRGYAGEMKYLEDSRRRDPQSAMAGVRSVVVCALSYNTKHPYSTQATDDDVETPRGWISRFAWGSDYHEVLWEKLNALVAEMKAHIPGPFEARGYADTGPVNERVLAKHAGLGWLGKNTLLLNQRIGSYFFLGTILTTLELEPTLTEPMAPPRDLCGSCTRCIDACPTQALVEPYVMDARKCISYLTIELKGSIPEEFRQPMGRHVFGCDICQDVCPWNRKAPATEALEFQPRSFSREESLSDEVADDESRLQESLLLPRLEWLAAMSEEEFRSAFRGSPLKRTKWKGLVRNACIALGNTKVKPGSDAHARIRTLLERLAASGEPAILESAQWALARIQAER
jgi:epoxyqueuosine reductase